MAESPTLYFPGQKPADSFVMYPEVGSYAESRLESTLVQESVGGIEQRRSSYPVGGRTRFAFRTMELTKTQAQLVRDFLRSVRGRRVAFWFFEMVEQYYYRENVGIADGTANLQIPIQGIHDVTEVLDDGAGITFAVTPSYGSGGEARLTSLQGPPANGSVITATFQGKRRYVTRLDADETARQLFAGGGTVPVLFQWDIVLRELL